MVQLVHEDVVTTEVREWQGVHLLHFQGSTCSKKIRILLDIKKVGWVSHPINLLKRENNTDWFMGINPRGVVPVLVHDGQVHIESNDIIQYLDQTFPANRLMPESNADELNALLALEDELHLDLRNLTMRYTAPTSLMQRTPAQLAQFKQAGSGTVGGQADDHKEHELKYWQSFAENDGVTDQQALASAKRFKLELQKLNARLQAQNHLLGDRVSLADISWFVTICRIQLAGYPVKRLHPSVWKWLQRLQTIPAFYRERAAPMPQRLVAKVIKLRDAMQGKSLNQQMTD